MSAIEIRLSGSGGQGILLACRILAEALTLEDMQIAQSQHYEPTSRGGLSRSDLIASNTTIDYPLANRLDYLVVLDQVAAAASISLLHGDSMVLIDAALVDRPDAIPGKHFRLPISDTARELHDLRSTNMVSLGALVTLGDLCPMATLLRAVEIVVPAKLVESSKAAVLAGQNIVEEP